MAISVGITVLVRGKQCRVIESLPVRIGGDSYILKVREVNEPHLVFSVITSLEPVEPYEVPQPSLEHLGRLALFRLFHQALLLESSGIGQKMLAPFLLPIQREEYQLVPVQMALSLPRPRLLIADDVGLGKTIEAGLILSELHARRRANRVLIVCPASLRLQWQREMQVKFGFRFTIFDRETLAQKRRELETGVNPWAYEPRIIVSMDFLKRPDGAFREVQGLHWDVVIVDEAHHLAPAGEESDTQLTKLGWFLAEVSDALILLTATPHNGYDESMATLLRFLDPTLAPKGQPLDPRRYRHHYIRRLKNQILNPDGSPKFVSRKPVQSIPVFLPDEERELHERVRDYAEKILEFAEKAEPRDRMAIQFVATILRKRAASSRAALKATLQRRLETLKEHIEEVEADREILRRWRRGEPLTTDEQRKLESDAYANYISAMRKLRRELVRLEDERIQVQGLLEKIENLEKQSSDPKLQALLGWLRKLHQHQPDLKVLVFSEYADTVNAIFEFLKINGYDSKVVCATGDNPESDQKAAIDEFLFGNACILVTTDIASEGLNLHSTCHHLVHFELPWNPNRLEQRNGRIDRYGQKKPPVIAFLYLEGTYEDEVLKLLLEKLDRKLRSEGSVTDILGSFQQERFEQILWQRKSISDVDKDLSELMQSRTPKEVLAEGEDETLSSMLQQTLPSTPIDFTLTSFLRDAVQLAGGRWEVKDKNSVSVQTPHEWLELSPELKERYERLFVVDVPDVPKTPPDDILHPTHPLLEAAIRWFHRLRFEPQKEEVRIAYQVADDIDEPEMVVTFLVSLQDETGTITTLLEPVWVTQKRVSTDERRDREKLIKVLKQQGGNVSPQELKRLFADWWQDGRKRAHEQAKARAQSYRFILQKARFQKVQQWQKEWQAWVEVREKEILGDLWDKYQQRPLFDGEKQLSPAVKKRLEQFHQRAQSLREHWERWSRVKEPTIEEIGTLLRVPKNAI